MSAQNWGTTLERNIYMLNESYSAQELAECYQISVQQALRYIARFGAKREELDTLLSSASRTSTHRHDEISRTSTEVALG